MQNIIFSWNCRNENMQDTSFWDTCLSSFKKSLPQQQYNSWIKPLDLKNENGTLVLTAPNSFTLKVVQERFLPEISRLAGLAFINVPKFELRILESATTNNVPNAIPLLKIQKTPVAKKPKIETSFRGYGKLNPSLTFRKFYHWKSQPIGFCSSDSSCWTAWRIL